MVDFGIAGVCTGNTKEKVDAGSLAYMPPEVIIFNSVINIKLGLERWL